MDENLWPKSLKKTKQRLAVIEALNEAGKPVSAKELFLLLERRGSSMWFSTIYRALETLLEHGAVSKAAVHENGTAVYELNAGHKHYAVCTGCSRVIAIHGCPLEGLMPDMQDKDFHVLGHKLQISGFCGECYGKMRSKP